MPERLQLSLNFYNDTMDTFEELVTPLRRNKEIGRFIITLLDAYHHSQSVKNAVDAYANGESEVDDGVEIGRLDDDFEQNIQKMRNNLAMLSVLGDDMQDMLDKGTVSISEVMNRSQQLAEELHVGSDNSDEDDFTPNLDDLEDDRSTTVPAVNDEQVKLLETRMRESDEHANMLSERVTGIESSVADLKSIVEQLALTVNQTAQTSTQTQASLGALQVQFQNLVALQTSGLFGSPVATPVVQPAGVSAATPPAVAPVAVTPVVAPVAEQPASAPAVTVTQPVSVPVANSVVSVPAEKKPVTQVQRDAIESAFDDDTDLSLFGDGDAPSGDVNIDAILANANKALSDTTTDDDNDEDGDGSAALAELYASL